MKILLVGNGFDIAISEKFKKEECVRFLINVLSLKDDDPDVYRFMRATEENKKCIFDFELREREEIAKSLKKNFDNHSLEDIYGRLLKCADGDVDFENKLFNLFEKHFSFIERISLLELSLEEREVYRKRLETYDLIITTNYTSTLSKLLNSQKNNIINIHGKIDTEYKILLGEKFKMEDTYEIKLFEYFIRQFKNANIELNNLFWRDSITIDIDIFGMSFNNDSSKLTDFLRCILYSLYLEYYNNRHFIDTDTMNDFCREKPSMTYDYLYESEKSYKQVRPTEYCENNFDIEWDFYWFNNNDRNVDKNFLKNNYIYYYSNNGKIEVGLKNRDNLFCEKDIISANNDTFQNRQGKYKFELLNCSFEYKQINSKSFWEWE